MENNKIDMQVKRLERLKQETILRYLQDINLDNPTDLYENLLRHLFCGDFDSIFPSNSLIGIDQEEKAEVYQLTRRYKNLCFYQGDPANWIHSVVGFDFDDAEFICMKILDHYDFLVGLARDGGERALKQINAFQEGPMSVEGSVVECLRNTFQEDDILRQVLVEMSKKDGAYAGLSDVQKEVLCNYPEGILFVREGENSRLVPVSELIQKMQKAYFATEADGYDTLESIGKLFPDREHFEDMVLDVYFQVDDDSKEGIK